MAKKGTAYYHLLKNEFISKYKTEEDIPLNKIARAKYISKQNSQAFTQAEALGWRHSKLQ